MFCYLHKLLTNGVVILTPTILVETFCNIFYFFLFQLFLLLILENIYAMERIINFLKCVHCRKGGKAACECTDDDVKEEHKLTELVVKDNQIEDYPIVVSNLQKSYGNVNAVNGINFTVKKGECFGLLGMNGAGSGNDLLSQMSIDVTF